MMPASEVIALIIAFGYLLSLVGLWRVRGAFSALSDMGWLLIPTLGLWVVFYLSVAFVDQNLHRDIFVWLSRTAHVLQLTVMFIVVRIGMVILDALEEGRDDGSD